MFPYYEGMGRVYTDEELEELKINDKSNIILTDKEKNTIKNYTRFDATNINKAIRLNNITSDIQSKIDILDSVIQKAEPLLNETNVYRGTIIQSLKGFENNKSVDQSVILGLKNQIISDKAFVSTSKIKAEDQGRNIIMSIKLPKGYKGAIEIKDYATEKYKYQDEVLLKRNTKFFVNFEEGFKCKVYGDRPKEYGYAKKYDCPKRDIDKSSYWYNNIKDKLN